MSGLSALVIVLVVAGLFVVVFWVMKHRAVPAGAAENPSLTPLQEDARRYLSRWVAIAAAWTVATSGVLLWSATAGSSGDGRTSIAQESSPPITPTAPTPHTVTALPAPGEQLPLNTDPEPTRWPPPSTRATTSLPAASASETPQFVSVQRLQSGVLTVGGTADELYACGTQDTAYPRIIQRVGETTPQVWRSYCFASNGALLVDTACAEARQLWGTGTCVLYRRGEWKQDSYSVAVLLDSCSSTALSVGAQVPENCVGRPR